MSTPEVSVGLHRRLALPRGRRPGLAGLALGFIVLWAVLALLSSVIAPGAGNLDLAGVYEGVGAAGHPLGTDGSGRDVLERLIRGAPTALLAPLVVILVSGTVGVALALLAALRRGWVDAVLGRLFDLIFAFPAILLALMGVAIFGVGLPAAVGALCIAYVPYVARVVRSEALRQTSAVYVQACRLNGMSDLAIAWRHLLPNLMPLVVAQLTLSFGYAIIDLAAISFLGLGVQAPRADWGLMVQTGQAGIIGGHPEESLFAGILIVLLVIAFSVVGDELDTRYERRRRG